MSAIAVTRSARCRCARRAVASAGNNSHPDRFERGYTVTTEVKPKGDGDFIAGAVCMFLLLAFFGWLFG
jgi:hypothetical protein